MDLIEQACQSNARLCKACKQDGIACRTLQSWLGSIHQTIHRNSERAASKRHKPFALKVSVVNQVYGWDITYLPTMIKAQYF